MINVREFGPRFGDVGEVSAGMPNTELSVAGATRSTLARSATDHARPLGLHADSGHGGRAMILCAAGDIHGALERIFENVLAFEESCGAARQARGGRRAAGVLAAMDFCD